MTHPRSISDRLLPKGRKKGESSVSHTKTLMERANSRNQLSPLPARSLIACYRRDARKIGEGFGEWSEAPSYEEGVGVDGGIAGFCLQWGRGGNPQWVKPTFLQLFQKKFRQVCHSQTTGFYNVVTLYPITRESESDLSPGTN